MSKKILMLVVGLLVIAGMVSIGMAYYKSPNYIEINDQPVITSDDSALPASDVHTLDTKASTTISDKVGMVTVTIHQISFGNSGVDKPTTKTQTIAVYEGQSFYASTDQRPIITKPVFTLEKINSATSVQLSHSNEVALIVNNKVIQNAPVVSTLQKGSKQCFATLWEDSGYKFCISL
jgi:hypothetical protein